jgi:hypothetical protein
MISRLIGEISGDNRVPHMNGIRRDVDSPSALGAGVAGDGGVSDRRQALDDEYPATDAIPTSIRIDRAIKHVHRPGVGKPTSVTDFVRS